ncbi:hypothetical protein ACFL0V_04115 [Nanoarchaeota archaeon]
MELPQYTLHHTIKRMVVPRVITLLILSPLFYVGIFVNAKLLNFEIPSFVAVFIILVLVVMVVVQSVLNYVRFQKYRYLFYTNRIDYEGKKPATFLFANFQQVELKQNIFDKMFNTGSIKLSKEFSIGPIANVQQIKAYMEQLVQYYRFTQQRYKIQQAEQGMRAGTAQTVQAEQQTSEPVQAQTAEPVSTQTVEPAQTVTQQKAGQTQQSPQPNTQSPGGAGDQT